MSEPRRQEALNAQQDVFSFQLVVFIWRVVLWILAVSDVGAGASVVFGPPATRISPAFQLMQQISLPNYAVGGILVLAGVLLLFRKTMTAGHFLSFIANGWWSLLILYIVTLLHQPSTLVAASWTGALALIHLVAGAARIYLRHFKKGIARISGGSDG